MATEQQPKVNDPRLEDVELEILDDTPEADKGQTKLSKEKLEQIETSDKELEKYSEDVKKRISQARHAYHDQRRAAEEAQRERDAALEYAKAMKAKAEALQQQYSAGEKVFVEGMQGKAKTGIEAARLKLKAATEAFDADAIADATQELTRAIVEEQKYAGWQQNPAQNAGQPQNSGVQQPQFEQPRSPTVPQPDARARKWASENPWFEVDKVMTGAAYGIHSELASEGVTAASDPEQYYGEIDRRLREIFPSKFEAKSKAEDADTSRTPVAPVRRSASGKRVVTLTKSQESMAKRLGLTPAQYAQSVIELESRNG